MAYRFCLLIICWGALRVVAEAAGGFNGERGRFPREFVPFASDEAVRRNFSVAVDQRGRIVAANGRVLLYDGWNARELMLPRPADTGAVALDGRGRIWVGNHEELGWFEEQPDGAWKFTSIVAELPEAVRSYQLLWAVHCVGDTVFFVAAQQVMIWRDGHFSVVPLPNVRRLFSSVSGEHCYVWQRESRETGTHLWRFTADGRHEKILTLPELYSAYEVLAADERGVEFVSGLPGVERFEFSTGRRESLLKPFGAEGHTAVLTGVRLAGGQLILGTGSSGLIGFDPTGRKQWAATVASGELPDNSVEAVALDAGGSVWGVTPRGLVKLESDAGVTTWRAEEGVPVTVNSLTRFEGRLLFATPVGVFRLVAGEADAVPGFERVSAYNQLFNDLTPFGAGQLMISGMDSYALGMRTWGVEPHMMEAGRGAVQLPGQDDLLVWANLSVVRVLREPRPDEEGDGWKEAWSRRMELVDRLAAWRGLEFVVANNSGAIDLVELRRTAGGVEEAAAPRRLTAAGGIGRVLRFEQQGGWLLAFTRAGVWRWRESLDQFEPLPIDAPAGVVPFAFHFDERGRGWAVATLARDFMGSTEGTRQLLLRVEWQADGRVQGLNGLPVAVVNEIGRPTCVLNEGEIWWLGGTGGLARIDLGTLARTAPMRLDTAPYLTSVRHGEGVTTTGGSDTAGQARGFEVEFGFPRHLHGLPVGFETRLSPLETEWSPVSTERRRAFASLPGGNYEFQVRVRDAAGQHSPELRWPVRVAPRFRETIWFLVVLVSGVTGLGGIIFAVWTRRLRRRKAELEHTVGERTAALLATNEELRGQNQRRIELIGAVSHELRTPLTGAYLMAEKLVAQPTATAAAGDAERLRSCLAELRNLLEGTLDVSRYELGLIPVQLRWVRLAQVVAETAGLFRPLAEGRGLAWGADLPDTAGPVLVDEPNLRRILANLISNAVKYTERGGVTVSLRWVTEMAPFTWAEFRVQDTGRGMTPAVIERLFAAFQRIELRADDKTESAGLGLVLTKRLVDLAGGEITCESKPGEGTVFCVRLPVVVAPGDEPVAPFAAAVLVVEDEAAHREHAVEILEPLGASVTVAGTLADALRLTRERRFEIALVDFNLPDGTGLELLQLWRAKGTTPGRSVLVSAHRSAPIREICLKAGFADVLNKPLSVRAALELLARGKG